MNLIIALYVLLFYICEQFIKRLITSLLFSLRLLIQFFLPHVKVLRNLF